MINNYDLAHPNPQSVSTGLRSHLTPLCATATCQHAHTFSRRNDSCCTRQAHPHAREHVTEILSEAGVSKAFIAITSNNRVTSSRQLTYSFFWS
jgi:hypothetical protein